MGNEEKKIKKICDFMNFYIITARSLFVSEFYNARFDNTDLHIAAVALSALLLTESNLSLLALWRCSAVAGRGGVASCKYIKAKQILFLIQPSKKNQRYCEL
jgi:hypothetical protein